MNYYERHLGDYMKNCGHLSLLEHGVYVRLLDVYYTREAPIPAEKAARLIQAATAPETEALQAVLEEFFVLIDGHWHQQRADEEIAAYQAGEPEREAKRANETNRLQRHRAERAELFKIITDAGLHAPWNIKIDELRKLAEGVNNAPETETATKPETATATPATATQTPDTNTQTPIPIKEQEVKSIVGESDQTPPSKPNGNHAYGLEARELLAFLNAKTGHGYKAVPANLDLITARLKEGFEAQDIRSVIAMKVREWKDDDSMRKYLRPDTLFNRTKFAQYHGQLVQTPSAQLELTK